MSLFWKEFVQGAGAEGFLEQSAMPLTHRKHQTLMQCLRHAAHQAAAVEQLVNYHDLVCFALML